MYDDLSHLHFESSVGQLHACAQHHILTCNVQLLLSLIRYLGAHQQDHHNMYIYRQYKAVQDTTQQHTPTLHNTLKSARALYR